MAKNKILYIVLFILGFCEFSYSQQTNPFEIESRKSVISTQKTTNKDNVFNLDSRETTIPQSIKLDSTNPFELRNTNKIKINNSLNSKKISKEKNIYSFAIDSTNESKGNSDFLLWLFLFILTFIAILLSFNRDLVLKIFKSIWYYNLTNTLFRNFGNRDSFFYILLFLNFLVNLAILSYLFVNKFHDIIGIHRRRAWASACDALNRHIGL